MLSSARLMAILALLLGGCMTGRSGFDQLAPEEQSLFQRCSQPIGEHLCSGEEPEARALCLKKQAATFAARGSARMRRSWLRSNECPAATLEASTAPVAAGARRRPAEFSGGRCSDQLQGTPLEGCLRSLASRWIFPRTARAYAVEAPLKVSGIESRRP
jgi:hypothetical protein